MDGHGRWRLARAALIATAAGAAVAAALPQPISKLTGSTEESAQSVMTHNGYAQRSEKSSWGRKSSFWWSGKARQCVRLTSLAGRIAFVDPMSESHCTAAADAGGAMLDPTLLVGLPRAAADARLASAGFNAINTDMSKGDTIYVWWFNGRQCLAGNIVGDRYEMLQAMPLDQCRK